MADDNKPETIVRCIALPINGPVDADWAPLAEALRQAWGMATAFANWCVTELLKRDPGRSVKDKGLRPMPYFDLYKHGLTNKRYPDWRLWVGAKGSASSVTKSVWEKYKRERLAIQMQGSRSAASYRYPFPWPVRAQDWKAYRSDDARRSPCLSVLLPGGRFDVRLRAGPEFARQLRTFDLLVSGEATGCELKITRQRSGGGRSRALPDRENGGGAGRLFREMARLAVRLPKPAAKGGDLALLLSTDRNAFWVAQIDGRVERPWIVNADHVRRREAEHASFLQRIGEDFKPEKRWPHGVRRRMNEHREARCDKHNRFVATWCQQASAMVRSYCQRNGVGCVVYDDSCPLYCEGFPWSRLKSALRNCLEQAGIELVERERNETEVA